MINTTYQPADFEKKWYQRWETAGYFKAGVGARPLADGTTPTFSILLPPPNVTGTLHMGHAFQHSLMDALTRYHRMRGFDVLWQPGTDHAGIATQLVVERQLESEGLHRNELGREKFIDRVWSWRHESGNTITRQMRRLGSSCDWSREKFTMDEDLSQVVTAVFVKLYREGLIYRGKRMVSWDPKIKTAVSDLEVENQERQGFMWHILYPFSEGMHKDHLGNPLKGMTIATTRPETMLADGALAVHPEDERYRHLIGQFVDLPLCDRKIPIIADDFVDRDFGSGCVKITGAHDANDYQCALRHGIELITIMDESATMNGLAPERYRGMDRYDCRQAVVADLETQHNLVKVEPHTHMVPVCARTNEVIEPMLTDQWFVKMDSLAQRGLKSAEEKRINFVPEPWINTYHQWLNNIQDWCISRQLWWGHRIPAWFDDEGNIFVAESEAEAKNQAGGRALRQDNDVLDTWFSSALWPFSTLGWQSAGEETSHLLSRYLPTSVLITGFDIIFFWVARMVMMTEHVLNTSPFRDVHITGLVRDGEGHKMSKSKGNIIDPIDLMDGIDLPALLAKRTQGLMLPHRRDNIIADTKKHFSEGISAVGADALRFTFLALATHGRDIKFDHHRCEGYRNFCTKLWNATRFVLIQCEEQTLPLSLLEESPPTWVDQWMINRLQHAEGEMAEHFAHYRFDWVARTVFELVWHDFCDWYLEASKVQLIERDSPLARATKLRSARILEAILRLAHPLIPFITEELWQALAPVVGINLQLRPTIMLEPYPIRDESKIQPVVDTPFAVLQRMVETCRKLRSEMKLSPQTRIPLVVVTTSECDTSLVNRLEPYLKALAKLASINVVSALPATPAPSAVCEGMTLMLLVEINVAEERMRVTKELARIELEIQKIKAQLGNEAFLAKAPPPVLALANTRLASFHNQRGQLQDTLAKL
jgi:valyl-tRNA synthetase